jgi:hypothetical protein
MARFDTTTRGVLAVVAFGAAACGKGGDVAGTGGNAGTSSSSGSNQGGATNSSVVSSTASTGAVAVSSSGSGGGSMAFVCDPPAAPGSIYERSAESYAEIDPVSMCRYRGDVMLLVNTAAL